MYSPKKGASDPVRLAGYWKSWSDSIKHSIMSKNVLNQSQSYYRNLGLILGVILFAAGCIVPVAMSIWSGYLMLPVGMLLFWYSLSIQKRTQYRMTRVRALKKLRKLITGKDFDIVDMPGELSDPMLMLAFGIVLGVENKLLDHVISLNPGRGSQSFTDDDGSREKTRNLVYKAIMAINDTLVSSME